MEPVGLHPFGVMLRVNSSEEGAAAVPMSHLLNLLKVHRLVLVRGMDPLERDAFLHLCRDSATDESDPCLHWDFGPVMDLKVEKSPKNYLFSSEDVPFHWDGAFHKVPDALVFNCIEAPAADAGGETLFSHTQQIYAKASEDERALWERLRLTYQTEKLAHYGGTFTTPLVARHPHDDTPILRIAEPVATDLNPVRMSVEGLVAEEADSLIGQLIRSLYAPEHCYVHQWEKGDLLLADNHALVHGRRAFAKHSPRHIRRIQLLQRNDS